jgi:hypothetical protein
MKTRAIPCDEKSRIGVTINNRISFVIFKKEFSFLSTMSAWKESELK